MVRQSQVALAVLDPTNARDGGALAWQIRLAWAWFSAIVYTYGRSMGRCFIMLTRLTRGGRRRREEEEVVQKEEEDGRGEKMRRKIAGTCAADFTERARLHRLWQGGRSTARHEHPTPRGSVRHVCKDRDGGAVAVGV